MVAHTSRHLTPLTAILLDLDHFKQVNDTYGHEKGDEVLAAVGAALRDALRAADFIGRYGGEEFLILLPDTDQTNALLVAEKIHQSLRTIRIPGIERATTASLGVATIPDDAGDAATLIRYADAALLTAKRAGRNRTETSGRIAGSPADDPHTSPTPQNPAVTADVGVEEDRYRKRAAPTSRATPVRATVEG
jgi:diguanylate cyclase (GGDEF)-like protein